MINTEPLNSLHIKVVECSLAIEQKEAVAFFEVFKLKAQAHRKVYRFILNPVELQQAEVVEQSELVVKLGQGVLAGGDGNYCGSRPA